MRFGVKQRDLTREKSTELVLERFLKDKEDSSLAALTAQDDCDEDENEEMRVRSGRSSNRRRTRRV